MNKSNRAIQPLALSILLTAILAGCGGGGGTAAVPGPASSGPIGAVCSGAGCVDLGTAANYVILAKTGVSTVPRSVVTGNIGLSPAARGYLTGWSLIGEPTDTAYISAQVVGGGHLYADDMVGGTTKVDLGVAVLNMGTAYTAAQAMAGGPCAGTGHLGGLTLVAGHYTCAVDVDIATGTNLTLSGSSSDIWVFQITGKLTQAAATHVILTGGALPQNVFWQVSGNVDIGTTAIMQGVILAQTLINVQAGATENGRLLAQSAVTLDKARVTKP